MTAPFMTIPFEAMNALQRRLHNAACVLQAEGDDHGFAQLQYDAIYEIERLRKDAERYRFLRQDFSPMGVNIDGNHAWAYRRNATLIGPNLDAAIDAAMEKS